MARPKKCRRICGRPAHSCFKPNGIPLRQLTKTEMLPEEFEAIRLADYNNLTQQEAADQMEVSRQTFGNIVSKARYKLAASLVEGNAIMIKNEESEI